VQSSSQIITTNKPTSSFFTGGMPFLSPNQQCQSTEGKISHSMDLLIESSHVGLPTLPLTTNSSWLPWGRVAMPLISPLMTVPLCCPYTQVRHRSTWWVWERSTTSVKVFPSTRQLSLVTTRVCYSVVSLGAGESYLR